MSKGFSRRSLLKLISAGAVVPALGPRAWAADEGPIDALYRRAVVIDGLSFAHKWDDIEYRAIDETGYSGIITSLPRANLKVAIDALMEWRKRIRDNPERFLMALSGADFRRAKSEGKLAVLMNFQNATMLEGNADNVEVLHALGMRCFQLTYNQRNRLGDGSTERTDAGLSDFGIEVVERMNALGVLVDLSHSGRQTTMDGVAFSDKPVAFTHTMCETLRPNHPRAKTDSQIRALAEKGGVIGLAALGYFVGTDPGGATTIETYADHIDHAIGVAGLEHVALATDFPLRGIASWATKEAWYAPRLKIFKPSYDLKWPPWIPSLDQPDRYIKLAHVLNRRGYGDDAIERILGLNWLRLFRDVYGA